MKALNLSDYVSLIGPTALHQSTINYQAGNYTNAAIWGVQGGLEIAAAAVTGGASQFEAKAASNLQAVINETTTLYRAVMPTELADIQVTNALRNLGSAEGKYFTTSSAW